jgi:hypothetical protein
MGLLQSDTDYTVYAYGYGVPGLDMAFYKGRGFYHTTRDNVNETSPGSMQHVGDNMLAVTRRLANADWVTGQTLDYKTDMAREPSMFFDVLGRMSPRSSHHA